MEEIKGNPECPICMTDCFNTLLCRTPCGHKLCMECALLQIKYECPTCRRPFPYLKNLIRARKLFTKTKNTTCEEIPIYDNEEFPSL